ncbi:MAG: hypothetical protein PHF67_05160 [Candidatus Nanoarchaeia archaeon]|nr:hypothetical protein [Candidatus Nanoarchaeia archaeon]
MQNNFLNKKGQLTIFIIIAIVIIALVALFFIFRTSITGTAIPKEFEGVYSYYLSCIDTRISEGASLLGQQGGYIENPEFSSGSEFMPFSSQLNFLGTGVPYWYYISGNNVVREQKPSKEKMQSQLNDFISQTISECDFASFNQQGFEITLDDAQVESSIEDNSISVDVSQNINIVFGNSSWNGKTHKVKVNSNLGKFYNLADEIYSNNKQTMFLENYGVDILRLNAPVDGSEVGCNAKVWNMRDIQTELMDALERNTPFIKIQGNYYNLGRKENQYFVNDIGTDVDMNVNFMYSKEWPMKLEAWPSENGILRADPVGLQEGLGMLGFCYVSYHFVYDFAYPILVQIYDDDEMFQFPVVVYINKNNPREALEGETLPDVVPDLCKKKNTNIKVYTYSKNLEPIEAEIKFKCFDTVCDIGKTAVSGEESVLETLFPQCYNGFVLASAEGYETGKYQLTDLEENNLVIVLNQKYKLNLEVQKDGNPVNGFVVLTFTKDKTQTVSYPEQKEIELSEGQYQIQAYIYSNSSIYFPATSTDKCVDVPRSGALGALGFTEKKCFSLNIPSQTIDSAVSGGGTQNYYIGDSELENSKKIIINANDFGIPRKVEDLQINYNKVDSSDLDVRFE